MFYSKTTRGFYTEDIHGNNIPSDVVEVSKDEYERLFTGQADGKEIVADENGYPILKEPDALTVEELSLKIREERNKLLSQSDWTQHSDSPLNSLKKADWTEYRQALRDVPLQPGFPASVVWPTKPA